MVEEELVHMLKMEEMEEEPDQLDDDGVDAGEMVCF